MKDTHALQRVANENNLPKNGRRFVYFSAKQNGFNEPMTYRQSKWNVFASSNSKD